MKRLTHLPTVPNSSYFNTENGCEEEYNANETVRCAQIHHKRVRPEEAETSSKGHDERSDGFGCAARQSQVLVGKDARDLGGGVCQEVLRQAVQGILYRRFEPLQRE